MALSLPSFAPFPSPAWRELIALDEWNACLGAWISLAEAHLGLLDSEFTQKSLKDESLQQFLTDCMRQVASSGSSILGTSNPAKLLMKDFFLLTARILKLPSIPSIFTQWEFLADFSRVYGKKRVAAVLSSLPKSSQAAFEHTLGDLKKFLIRNLDAGLAGDLKAVEQRLDQLNSLIHASPSTASFFLAGSDFLDGLISCYKIMNPPLRKVIITTTYLSLVGLIEGESPKLSMLTDQLYSLKTAADTHKAGPLNVNDSLVAELVTTTPILQQIEHKLEVSGTATTRTKNVLKDLAAYRKPGVGMKPKRLIKRKVDKGKALALDDRSAMEREIHIHHMSQISQIQDLFPELGSGFVSKLLDEYDGDSEQVIAHLLEDSLPPHLQGADRGEELCVYSLHSYLPVTNIMKDHPIQLINTIQTLRLTQHRHKYLPGRTCSTTTSWIPSPSARRSCISANATLKRPQTTCWPIDQRHPTRPRFYQRSRPSTQTTTSATTRTTRKTWAAQSTPPTRRSPPTPRTATRRRCSGRTRPTRKCLREMPPRGAALRGRS